MRRILLLLKSIGYAGILLWVLWSLLLSLKIIAVYLCTHGWLVN